MIHQTYGKDEELSQSILSRKGLPRRNATQRSWGMKGHCQAEEELRNEVSIRQETITQ